jgi:cyclophilin family peptidyl-prolyl cis-trans isomerase
VDVQSTAACSKVSGRIMFEVMLTHPVDDSFAVRHDRPGVLSMGNRGPHSNTSQVRP